MGLAQFGLGKSPHHWGIVAKPKGKHGGLRFVVSCGIRAGSPDDALNHLRLRLAKDVNFRRTYNGWSFMPVLVDHVVSVEGPLAVTR